MTLLTTVFNTRTCLVGVLQEREVDGGLEEARVAVCIQESVDALLGMVQGLVRWRLQQLDSEFPGLAVQVHLVRPEQKQNIQQASVETKSKTEESKESRKSRKTILN